MEPNRRSKYSDEGIIMDTQKKKSSARTSEWRKMVYLACTSAGKCQECLTRLFAAVVGGD